MVCVDLREAKAVNALAALHARALRTWRAPPPLLATARRNAAGPHREGGGVAPLRGVASGRWAEGERVMTFMAHCRSCRVLRAAAGVKSQRSGRWCCMRM